MRLTIAKNTISQLFGKVISAAATFLISILLAKKFGFSGYGDFVKITTYISFFFLIADFGLNAVYLQRQKDSFSPLLSARILGGIFLVFLSLALLAFLPQGTTQGYTNIVRFGIIVFSPAVFFQALITSTNAIFQKRLRYDVASICLFVGSVCTIGTLLLLLQTSMPASIIGPLSLLCGSATTALIALWAIRKMNELPALSFSSPSIRALVGASFPLGITLFFSLVYGHVDSVILTLTRTTSEVGIYGLAYKAFELILVFPTFFMNAVYPLLVKTQGAEFLSLLKKSFLFLFVASLMLSIGAWIGAPLLVHIQPDFSASIAPLRVLSMSLPLFFISSLTMWGLIALKKQLLLSVIYGIAMIINISLNIFLIPTYGYMAAAWTTLGGEAFVLAISGFFVLRYIRTL